SAWHRDIHIDSRKHRDEVHREITPSDTTETPQHVFITEDRKNRAEVELATLTWVDWYNNRRLLERLGHTPPAEAEKAYYAS
ncbi:hypothetical protein ACSLNR_29680, partial [Escherichia coli]